MKYLKCDSCQHYNLLNSEYQVFCDACGKKMNNNYKAWQKKFPSKTFEDYMEQVGVSKKPIKKRKNKSLKRGFQALAIIVFIALGVFFVKKYDKNILNFFYAHAYSVSDLLDKEWEHQFFRGNKISIESPYWLQKIDNKEVSAPPEVKKLVKAMDIYAYRDFAGFGMSISIIDYDKTIGTMNLQGAADGGIYALTQELNGTDLFYNDEDIFIDEQPAFLKQGTFNVGDETYSFKHVSCAKNKLTLVSLTTIWPKKNEDYGLLTDRILNSLKLN